MTRIKLSILCTASPEQAPARSVASRGQRQVWQSYDALYYSQILFYSTGHYPAQQKATGVKPQCGGYRRSCFASQTPSYDYWIALIVSSPLMFLPFFSLPVRVIFTCSSGVSRLWSLCRSNLTIRSGRASAS